MKRSSFRSSFIVNTEPIEPNLKVYLQINMVNYNVDRDIMITYENL
jgi:hypothetical protein